MIAAIIPYFLACNISLDPAWPNGPEYVYHVKGNVSVQWRDDLPAKMVGYDLTIHCRPRNSGTISCIYNNGTVLDVNGDSLLIENVRSPRRFEIEFNDKGAENITVPEDMDMTSVSFTKTFASLFNVGADLSGKTDQDGIFQAMNSTVEQYKMNVKIGYTPDTEYNKANNLYQLEFLQAIDHPMGQAIEITQDKLVPLDGVYRTIEIPSLPPGNNTMTILHRIDRMNNRMKISKHSLELYTHAKGMLSWTEMGTRILYEGFIETTLMDVIPADGPIPKIANPTTISILQQDAFEQYFG